MAGRSTEALLNEALRARNSGNEPEARRHFDSILEIEPDHPVVRNALGIEALEKGQLELAAEHFDAATRGDPKAPAIWMNLAKARRLLNDDEAERAALEQVLSIDQTHLMALIRLAQLHERRGEIALAKDRWFGVGAVGSQIPQLSAELVEIVRYAREFVSFHNARLAEAIDARLAADLDRASPRDRRRAKAASQVLLGRRKVYFNECFGLHYPFLPADEYFDREHFPWLQRLEAATPVVRQELEAILREGDATLEPYVDMPPGTPENKWTPLNRSLDWGSMHLWREGERIDAACERAPQTAALVDSLPVCHIPGRAPHVFFSILKAGKTIPPHTGVTNVRAIVHLPLIVPGDCAFRVGGETREWREGEAFVFDDTIEHEAWNRSDRDRAVLILDTWNPHLSEHEQRMICDMFETMAAERAQQT